MKMLCRFCEKEFEFEGDGQALAKETIDHIREAHPEKAKEMQSRLFNLMKEYYIIQRGDSPHSSVKKNKELKLDEK